MNNTELSPIKTHDDLMRERKRLEMNIAINKVLLQREYDAVKSEVVEKVRPVATALHVTRQILHSLKTPSVVMGITSLFIHLITRRKQAR